MWVTHSVKLLDDSLYVDILHTKGLASLSTTGMKHELASALKECQPPIETGILKKHSLPSSYGGIWQPPCKCAYSEGRIPVISNFK